MSLITFEINTVNECSGNDTDVECGLVIWKTDNTFDLLCKFCEKCFVKLEEFVTHTTSLHKKVSSLVANNEPIQEIKKEPIDPSYVDDPFQSVVVKEEENFQMETNEFEIQPLQSQHSIVQKPNKAQDLKTGLLPGIKCATEKLPTGVENLEQRVENLTKEMHSMKVLLKSLVSSIQTQDKNDIIIDETFVPPCLPFTNFDDLKMFNDKLVSDETYMNQMVIRLYKIAKPDIKCSVTNMVRKLIGTQLLSEFSWTGLNRIHGVRTKRIFAELVGICLLILKANNYKNNKPYTNFEIQQHLKKMVRRSTQYYEREKNRHK